MGDTDTEMWDLVCFYIFLLVLVNSAMTCITLTQLIHTGESDCTAARFVRSVLTMTASLPAPQL